MELYSQIVQDEKGDIVNGATVTVYVASSGAVATVYDKDGVSQANPFLSGLNRSKGEIEFAAENGLYNVKVTNGASTVWHYNQALFDATSAESPIWSGNGIYNGKMTISQRGDYTSATSVTTSQYYLDRWRSELSGVTANVQDMGGSLKYTATSTATGAVQAYQEIERYSDYAGKEVTVSAKVTSNSTLAKVSIWDGSDIYSSSAHSGGGAEEELSVTVTLGAGISVFQVYCQLSYGSTTSGDYIEFTDVRLDLGSHRLSGDREYGEELALCQRYAFAIDGTLKNIGSGQCFSTTGAFLSYQLPVKMRVVPSLTISSAAHFDVFSAAGGTIACTALVLTSIAGEASIVMEATVAGGLAAGNATIARSSSASALLLLEAEL